MPWNPPPDFSVFNNPGASDFNLYVSQNPTYLLSGRALQYIARQGSSDYTTTSSTFADVDNTNLKLTLTINSGRALIHAEFWAFTDATSNNSNDARIMLDGSTPSGNSNGSANVPATRLTWMSFDAIFTGLSVGTHTFTLQFRSRVNTGTSTISNNGNNINFWGLEI